MGLKASALKVRIDSITCLSLLIHRLQAEITKTCYTFNLYAERLIATVAKFLLCIQLILTLTLHLVLSQFHLYAKC